MYYTEPINLYAVIKTNSALLAGYRHYGFGLSAGYVSAAESVE